MTVILSCSPCPNPRLACESPAQLQLQPELWHLGRNPLPNSPPHSHSSRLRHEGKASQPHSQGKPSQPHSASHRRACSSGQCSSGNSRSTCSSHCSHTGRTLCQTCSRRTSKWQQRSSAPFRCAAWWAGHGVKELGSPCILTCLPCLVRMCHTFNVFPIPLTFAETCTHAPTALVSICANHTWLLVHCTAQTHARANT